MSNTISFQCHIQISSKELKKVVGKTLTFMGNSKTIDENGKVVFDCELQAQDKAKSFPITIEDEEYVIVGTGKCNAIAHRDSTNPFCLMLNKDNEASIEYIRIYKEIDKADSDQKEQRDIYTAQVEKPNETTQQSNTNDTHNSQAKPQENQNLVNIEAHLTSGKALKKDIQWGYYIKQSNENLKAKVSIKDLKSFTFVSKDTYNTKVSLNLNTKFTYTITENNTQKEITDYLKDNQQLIIFAYKNNPAYNVGERITHTILTISQYPILKLTNKALTILYAHTNATYTLKHSCDTHYLSENLKSEKIYTLELRDSNLYIKDKESNKDIALMLTKEIPNIQEKTILLDSKDLQNLQTTLGLYTHRDRVEIYVEVQRAKRPSFESVKRAYDEILKVGNAEEVFSYIGGKLNEARIEAKKRKERGEMVNTYDNACATRVSYALNYGGMIINNAILVSGTKWQGKDQYLYYTGVSGIKGLLLENWKQLKPYSQTNNRDFYKIFYDHRKEPYTTLISYGKIINEQRVNKIRKDNLDFFHILCSLNIKGIVTMVIDGWGDAGGHTTLWNINHFLDNQNYLNYGDEIIFVRELCFWSLE